MHPPAGWHPDPYDPNIERFWDGSQWTAHTRPTGNRNLTQASAAPGEPQPQRRRKKWTWIVGAAVVGILGIGVLTDTGSTREGSAPANVTATSAVPTPATTASATRTTTKKPNPTSTATSVEQAPTTTSYTEPAPTTTTYVEPVPATTSSPATNLEYSCSDADWRESMGAEGNALCGSTWTPYNQIPSPAPIDTYTPSIPEPAYTPPPTVDVPGAVHPGSYCDKPGTPGVTAKGTAMVCAPGSDGRLRWQSAG